MYAMSGNWVLPPAIEQSIIDFIPRALRNYIITTLQLLMVGGRIQYNPNMALLVVVPSEVTRM